MILLIAEMKLVHKSCNALTRLISSTVSHDKFLKIDVNA